MNEVTIDQRHKGEMVAGAPVVGIIPTTMDEVWRICDAIVIAGMVPSSYEGKGADPEKETKAKLMIGIMKGLEVGMGPITALSTIAVINNRPCIWGDGAIALCQRAGVVEWVQQTYEGTPGEDEWTAIYTVKRRGQADPYVGMFSVGQAKRAQLWNNPRKQPWMLYPSRMLMARARAYALRDGFADCLNGLGIMEEVQDIGEPPKGPVSTGFLDDAPEQIEQRAQPSAPSGPSEIEVVRSDPPAEIDPLAPYVLMDREGLEAIFDDAADIPKWYRAEIQALWDAGDGRKMGDFDRANAAVIKSLRPDVLDQIKAINREIRPKREPAA